MDAYYCDSFELPLPPGHRFPIEKYRLLRERIERELAGVELHEAPAATKEELLLAHDRDYVVRASSGELSDLEQRRIGFPWSPAMFERSLRSTGATLAASRSAIRRGIAVHLSGGTHHAFADQGQGFCVFNDVAVAIRNLQREGLAKKAVVIDLDVHQGNGTAAIFEKDDSVFTFSMHGDRNYPFRKHCSDLDIALSDKTGDAEYCELLDNALHLQLPTGSADLVFYLAGADPFAGDRMGRVALSKGGLKRRDQLVLGLCERLTLPVVVVMAGGYSEVGDVVDIHFNSVQLAMQHSTRVADKFSRLAGDN